VTLKDSPRSTASAMRIAVRPAALRREFRTACGHAHGWRRCCGKLSACAEDAAWAQSSNLPFAIKGVSLSASK
jgi:hypothetical protein